MADDREFFTPEYFEVRGWEVEDGRAFEEFEVTGGIKIAVIGATVSENLFPEQSPIGEVIRINRVPFEVVGTLKAKGQSSFGQDQDDVLFVPLKAAQQRLIGGRQRAPDRVQRIYVLAKTPEQVSIVEREIEEIQEGRLRMMDDTRLRERFLQMSDTARGLLADFRQVEQNFRDLDRQVREKVAAWDGGKGDMLAEVFGEHDAITDTDQGRTFRAFWDFLMSDSKKWGLRTYEQDRLFNEFEC